MWTPDQFLETVEEKNEEPDPRMVASTTPVLMTHDTIIAACDFKEVEGRMTCPLDEYLCSVSYLQRALLTLERMSVRANPIAPNTLFPGFVTIVDAKPDFIKFKATQLNGEGVGTMNMVHYKIYVCPEAMTLKIRIDFGKNRLILKNL